jgi:hypothetical protein
LVERKQLLSWQLQKLGDAGRRVVVLSGDILPSIMLLKIDPGTGEPTISGTDSRSYL